MDPEKDLRKVKYYNGRDFVSAYFHQWGTTNFLAEDGKDFQVTIGIIELLDGKIVETQPKHIKFTESF